MKNRLEERWIEERKEEKDAWFTIFLVV